ncbi:MAG: matrixin family metalloprotease [Bdellovibrionota bacterium]|nr:matrixin family metalloprotease [Bdellovibrionota bacterium]
MKRLSLILLFMSFHSFAYRLNTSNSAAFGSSKIYFYVTSNSTCTNAGIDANELLDLAEEAADNFWNTVATSSVRLQSGGLYETSDSLFQTGILCPEQSGSSCNTATSIPYVSKLLIACNSETTSNFPSDDYIAIGAPTRLAGTRIRGSVILINDTATSPFAGLSRSEKISVLAHELGHAIGLGHSNKSEALMYYQNPETISALSQDDIDGVTYLYPNEAEDCSGIIGSITDAEPPRFLFQFLLSAGLFIAFWNRKRIIQKLSIR